MKDFYERTQRVWVKVSRRADKSFIFAIGYTGECKAFNLTTYSNKFLPTIKDAQQMAKAKAADYI